MEVLAYDSLSSRGNEWSEGTVPNVPIQPENSIDQLGAEARSRH